MEKACESYIISFVDDVNNIELMLSDRQETISKNIKIYTIRQDDLQIINVVNNNNKSLRIELHNKGDFHYYTGKFMFKEYVYIILYDGKTRRSIYSKYINLTDMNYNTKIFSMKECISAIVIELLSLIFKPNVLCFILMTVILILVKEDIIKLAENILNLFR